MNNAWDILCAVAVRRPAVRRQFVSRLASLLPAARIPVLWPATPVATVWSFLVGVEGAEASVRTAAAVEGLA